MDSRSPYPRNLRKKCFHRLGRAGTSISAHSAVASRQSRRSDNVARADTNESRKNRNHDLNLMPGRPRSTWGVQSEELQKTRFCYQQKREIVAPKLIKIILGRIYIGNAMQPLHDGLAQSLPDHRLLPEPCGKEDRKKFIIDTRRENPSMKAREIAQRAKCTADHVRKILKAHQATEREPPPEGPEAGDGQKWFERAVEANFAGLRSALEQVLLEGRNQPTSTNLMNPSLVRPITDRELEANTFYHDLNSTDSEEQKRSREWLRYHFSGKKVGGQGFVIMDAHSDKEGKQNAPLFEHLPALLDKPRYNKELKVIFQTLQAKNASGDGKRRQAKMTELLELAETRVVEAQQQVEAAAKRAKTKRRTVPPSKKSLKRRGATTTLDESLQTLREVEEERACLRAATDAMCLGFDRIQQVPALPCPYC